MTFVDTITADDAKSFTVKLKSPTGLLIFGLGKPSSNVPFMMPKRVADTDPNTQISEFIGSGPFVLKTDEWKPGDKIVYTKFKDYKPRAEPASGLAGGKVAKLDRIEWLAVTDQQQAVNALLAGEIDMIEQPAFDLIPLLAATEHQAVELQSARPAIHDALQPHPAALRQSEGAPGGDLCAEPEGFPRGHGRQSRLLQALQGDVRLRHAARLREGDGRLLESNFRKSQELLKEAGYDGKPIVLLHSTDLQSLTNLGPVAKQLLERGGFKVDMQSSDCRRWSPAASARTRSTRAAGT